VGAGAHRTVAAPALAAIELGDEFEQSVVGSVDLACQEGDLSAKRFVIIGERWYRREGEIGHGN
jgi:hypothetical protein